MVSFSIDPRFQPALREYMAHTEKDIAEVLNTKLFFIARGASRETPKADRAKYERELGVVSYRAQTYKTNNSRTGAVKGQIRRDKSGRAKFQRVFSKGPTLANLIINARKGQAGKPGLAGAAMKSAVGKMLGKRARSVGTLRAGWLGAIRILARAVGQARDGVDGSASRVEGRSRATPARLGWNPRASLEYLVNSFDKDHRPYIDRRVGEALRKAFDAEMRSMREYLARKMAGTAEKAHRKTVSRAGIMNALVGVTPELRNHPALRR